MMRIVFPELDNPIIKEAISKCPEIEAVSADDLSSAAKILSEGQADGMVAGIDATTRDVILACRDVLPVEGKYFSSCFVMTKGTETLILADGGVCKRPDNDMFYSVITQTYETAKKILIDEPKMALLSFSTFGSGQNDPSLDLIRSTLERVRSSRPEIIIDGEMQLDVALNAEVAAKKAANSDVAGHANVLICPDLNAGNILYKAMERLGGWTAAGPILQGFKKPVSDLSRGSTVDDVVAVIKVIEKLGE